MGTKFQQSSLLIGKSGVGKTTVLREITQLLSEDTYLNCLIVVVVDKLRTSRRMLSLLTTYRPPPGRRRGSPAWCDAHCHSARSINCRHRQLQGARLLSLLLRKRDTGSTVSCVPSAILPTTVTVSGIQACSRNLRVVRVKERRANKTDLTMP